jgi:hypothetical protein
VVNQLPEKDINDVKTLTTLLPKLQYADLYSGVNLPPTSFFYFYNWYNERHQINLIHIPSMLD